MKNVQSNKQYIIAFVILFVFLLAFWRAPNRLVDGFLWAEDALIFLKPAYEVGVPSVWTTYAGYFHLLPRIIAYLQSWNATPLSAPFFYAWSCVVISALGVAYMFHFATRFVGNWIFSALIAFAPFYVAHSGEVFFTITNLQWILAPVLLCLLIDLFFLQQKSLIFVLGKSFLLFVFVLTGPFGVLYVPVVLLILFLGKKNVEVPWLVIPGIVFFISVSIQAVATIGSFSESSALKPHLWGDRLLLDFLVQLFLSKSIISVLGGGYISWVLALLFLISILFLGRCSFLPMVLFLYSVCLWVIGVMRVNDPGVLMGPFGAAARYYFVPSVLLAWGLILCIKESPPLLKPAPSILLASMFLTGMSGFNVEVHKSWSITKGQGNVYDIMVPPGWRTTIKLVE